ncbi:antirestriction protein ArdA [Lacticaseibacillus paracasei]|uniref:Antirestriction protein ArdA n=1 Tax=Lacticaseibacillus paracasei subsp. paracasei Lpp49 TaxID=1256213 RepID=A0ABC9TAV4_LACPA|nr:antirestriction protein ArdA [Lacticaseibacillus paracasei]EPC90448.1 hypothetical protein Lpp49_09917 [Lacticaseibacillus paracasei subsp. paracasei Lpp49]
METVRVFIVNLDYYNQGKPTGKWFTPPLYPDAIAEQLELKNDSEEYAIHDYEAPFEIDRFDSIDEINRKYAALERLEEYDFGADVSALIGEWFRDIEELAENTEDIVIYKGVSDMAELAQDAVESGAVFGDLPDQVIAYLDFEALGRDMEIEGNYLVTNSAIYEYAN